MTLTKFMTCREKTRLWTSLISICLTSKWNPAGVHALTSSCYTGLKRQLFVRLNKLHPFVFVDRSSLTLALDMISSLSFLVRQRIHIRASVYEDPWGNFTIFFMRVVSDPEVDFRPIPKHARGDPACHVRVFAQTQYGHRDVIR